MPDEGINVIQVRRRCQSPKCQKPNRKCRIHFTPPDSLPPQGLGAARRGLVPPEVLGDSQVG
jgi:hypothetical protein